MLKHIVISPRPGLAAIDYYMVGISKLPGWEEPVKLSSNEILQRIVSAVSGPGDELVHSKNAYMQLPSYARSFSRVYGMAGVRLGWCYGPPRLFDMMTKIGPSFPVNTAAFAAGIEAFYGR